jgi:hypothetical protein
MGNKLYQYQFVHHKPAEDFLDFETGCRRVKDYVMCEDPFSNPQKIHYFLLKVQYFNAV